MRGLHFSIRWRGRLEWRGARRLESRRSGRCGCRQGRLGHALQVMPLAGGAAADVAVLHALQLAAALAECGANQPANAFGHAPPRKAQRQGRANHDPGNAQQSGAHRPHPLHEQRPAQRAQRAASLAGQQAVPLIQAHPFQARARKQQQRQPQPKAHAARQQPLPKAAPGRGARTAAHPGGHASQPDARTGNGAPPGRKAQQHIGQIGQPGSQLAARVARGITQAGSGPGLILRRIRHQRGHEKRQRSQPRQQQQLLRHAHQRGGFALGRRVQGFEGISHACLFFFGWARARRSSSGAAIARNRLQLFAVAGRQRQNKRWSVPPRGPPGNMPFREPARCRAASARALLKRPANQGLFCY